MAKRTKKITKTEEAAVITEASSAVQMMAEEMLGETTIDAEIAALEAEIGDRTVGDTLTGYVAETPVMDVEAEAVALVEALEEVSAPEAALDVTVSFDDMLSQIDAQDRQAAAVALTKAVDERAAFESANGNENIQKALNGARKAFSFPSTAAVLLACGVDERFVNRSMHEGKRYNVYAFGKLADAATALAGGAVNNRINYAVMRSLFNARKAGIAFTGEMAKMACSDKIRVTENAIKAILVRHTVSASTAPTQASSTMQALETLGIVKREGSHKNPTFTLTNHPAVAKLEEALAKAA
jgi:hypothetical protein